MDFSFNINFAIFKIVISQDASGTVISTLHDNNHDKQKLYKDKGLKIELFLILYFIPSNFVFYIFIEKNNEISDSFDNVI